MVPLCNGKALTLPQVKQAPSLDVCPNTHRQQDLQTTVQGFHIAVRHAAASIYHQGLAMHYPQANCGCLFMKTAWTMLFPPGAMPGEIEGQELTVLGQGTGQVCIRRQPASTNHRLE